MSAFSFDRWMPELALNNEFLCVRYRQTTTTVSRDVHSLHGQPIYFDTRSAARAQCELLNASERAAVVSTRRFTA